LKNQRGSVASRTRKVYTRLAIVDVPAFAVASESIIGTFRRCARRSWIGALSS
jgi:hypothetical protein